MYLSTSALEKLDSRGWALMINIFFMGVAILAASPHRYNSLAAKNGSPHEGKIRAAVCNKARIIRAVNKRSDLRF
jgi:hypothetical protein